MMVCKLTRCEDNCNHYSRFLFIIIIVALARGNLVAEANRIDCSQMYTTCTRCTNTTNADKAKCKWDVWQQTCVETSAKSRKTVSAQSYCPQFLVEGQLESDRVVVTISNDQTNLVSLMSKFGEVRCMMNNTMYNIDVNDNQITCTKKPDQPDDNLKEPMAYLSVEFVHNGQLQFDNVSDHYVHRGSGREAPCPNCNWDDGGFRYYCTWCNEAPNGEKAFQYCDKRKYPKLTPSEFGDSVTFVGNRCTAVTIESFSPNTKKRIGRTVLNIVVRNHEMLMKTNKNMDNEIPVKLAIRVAGRDCINVNHIKNKITCTLSEDSSFENSEGPVEVTYKGLLDITLVSTQNFTFNSKTTSSSPPPPSTPSSPPSSTLSPPPSTTVSQFRQSISLPPPLTTQSLSLSSTSIQLPLSVTLPPPSTTQSLFLSSTLTNIPTSTLTDILTSTLSQLPSSTMSQLPSSTTLPPPSTTQSLFLSSTLTNIPTSTLTDILTSTLSQLPSSTMSQLPSSTTLPPPSTTQSLFLSSTLSPSSFSTPSSTTKFPGKVNITEEAFNNNLTSSRTEPVLSTVFTIVIYVLFIMVICVALMCLKSPRTYNLLTFRLRQRPMQMRQFNEDQQLTRSTTDYDEHEDGYVNPAEYAARNKNQNV